MKHLQAESCIQQEIFLNVIPGRIIVPLLRLKKEGSAHFCYISTGQTAFLEHLECLYIPVFMFFSRDVGSIFLMVRLIISTRQIAV